MWGSGGSWREDVGCSCDHNSLYDMQDILKRINEKLLKKTLRRIIQAKNGKMIVI